jgi:hypothetical protein
VLYGQTVSRVLLDRLDRAAGHTVYAGNVTFGGSNYTIAPIAFAQQNGDQGNWLGVPGLNAQAPQVAGHALTPGRLSLRSVLPAQPAARSMPLDQATPTWVALALDRRRRELDGDDDCASRPPADHTSLRFIDRR